MAFWLCVIPLCLITLWVVITLFRDEACGAAIFSIFLGLAIAGCCGCFVNWIVLENCHPTYTTELSYSYETTPIRALYDKEVTTKETHGTLSGKATYLLITGGASIKGQLDSVEKDHLIYRVMVQDKKSGGYFIRDLAPESYALKEVTTGEHRIVEKYMLTKKTSHYSDKAKKWTLCDLEDDVFYSRALVYQVIEVPVGTVKVSSYEVDLK